MPRKLGRGDRIDENRGPKERRLMTAVGEVASHVAIGNAPVAAMVRMPPTRCWASRVSVTPRPCRNIAVA